MQFLAETTKTIRANSKAKPQLLTKHRWRLFQVKNHGYFEY